MITYDLKTIAARHLTVLFVAANRLYPRGWAG
jgi:hypothetical protein